MKRIDSSVIGMAVFIFVLLLLSLVPEAYAQEPEVEVIGESYTVLIRDSKINYTSDPFQLSMEGGTFLVLTDEGQEHLIPGKEYTLIVEDQGWQVTGTLEIVEIWAIAWIVLLEAEKIELYIP